MDVRSEQKQMPFLYGTFTTQSLTQPLGCRFVFPWNHNSTYGEPFKKHSESSATEVISYRQGFASDCSCDRMMPWKEKMLKISQALFPVESNQYFRVVHGDLVKSLIQILHSICHTFCYTYHDFLWSWAFPSDWNVGGLGRYWARTGWDEAVRSPKIKLRARLRMLQRIKRSQTPRESEEKSRLLLKFTCIFLSHSFHHFLIWYVAFIFSLLCYCNF